MKKAQLPAKLSRQDSLTSLKAQDFDLAGRLNKYFRHFLDENPQLVNSFNAMFPLDYYDSTTFDEFLPIKTSDFPVSGACLVYGSGGKKQRAYKSILEDWGDYFAFCQDRRYLHEVEDWELGNIAKPWN